MAKQILISGIQSTGKLHIGNYLGMLKHAVELQNSGRYRCYYFIADLHSLTINFDPKEKQRQIIELAADVLAAGLDPRKSVIFQQSQVPAHSELAWILSTIAPIGELERMTQFKDKAAQQKGDIKAGLLTYPTLMAADIILYDANVVPVGDDQLQHLELARTLTRKFNKSFGKAFVEPKALLTKTARVMDLKNPEKKMSKSVPASCLFIDDSPKVIKEKIMRAVTDSGSVITHNTKEKPGISNLLSIYAELSGETVQRLELMYKGKNYAAFKKGLANVIVGHFAGFRAKKKAFLRNKKKLAATLTAGSKKADAIASKKIREVHRKVGLAL